MALQNSSTQRQKAIEQLVTTQAIADQQQLVELLQQHHGISTNQAVVSRDLRKLGVVKKSIHGHLIYEIPSVSVTVEILRLALIDITYNESLIVIKTQPGLAAFVGDYLDDCGDIQVLGCLAGENVVFVCPQSIKKIAQVYEAICKKFKFQKITAK